MASVAGVARGAARGAVTVVTEAGKAIPTGGGKGGAVLMVAGILFVGYLFLSRRLEGVLSSAFGPGAAGKVAPGTGAEPQGDGAGWKGVPYRAPDRPGGTPGIAPRPVNPRRDPGYRIIDPVEECIKYQMQTNGLSRPAARRKCSGAAGTPPSRFM